MQQRRQRQCENQHLFFIRSGIWSSQAGPLLLPEICLGLPELLQRDGYRSGIFLIPVIDPHVSTQDYHPERPKQIWCPVTHYSSQFVTDKNSGQKQVNKAL